MTKIFLKQRRNKKNNTYDQQYIKPAFFLIECTDSSIGSLA